MPGISGQFFKSFGFTVVVSVLISLLVARMITPMIAAYFLKAKGQAKHGEGWLMDRYMSILQLDPRLTKAEAMRAQLTQVPLQRLWFVELVFILLVIVAFGAALRWSSCGTLGAAGHPCDAGGLILALVAGYLAVKLLGLVIRLSAADCPLA